MKRVILVTLCILGIMGIWGITANAAQPIIQVTPNINNQSIPVTITKQGFTPAKLQIFFGTSVTWINLDTEDHIVAFDHYVRSPRLRPGESWTYKFIDTRDNAPQRGQSRVILTYNDRLNPTVQGSIAPFKAGDLTLNLNVTPPSPDQLVFGPQGGQLSYNTSTSNTSQSSASLQYWVQVFMLHKTSGNTSPNESPFFSNPGNPSPDQAPTLMPFVSVAPVLAVKPHDFSVAGGSTISGHSSFTVPKGLAQGTYYVVGFVGNYPNTVLTYTAFKFDVSGVQSTRTNFDTERNVDNLGTPPVANESQAPVTLSLKHYPEPFNPSTQITFALPTDAFVQLNVYNVQGSKVADLVSGQMQAGEHQVTFDASGLPTGMYLYRLTAGEQTLTGKMMLIK